MGRLEFKLEGGRSAKAFTCTGCRTERPAGSHGIEISVGSQYAGPLCSNCWPRVPRFLKRLAARPGVEIDAENIVAVEQEIQARTRAAKAELN